jgi:processive 1,2-diacylglycerol beta-glucosyltransferase
MKKILIFSSLGGGGHVSVVQALNDCLADSYQIKTVETVHDILKSVDALNQWTNGKYSGLTLYNYLIKNNKIFLCNLMTFIAKFFIKFRRKKITAVLRDYIEQEKPDLVISVIPLFNGYIAAATQQLDLPFLIIPSDANTTEYVFDCKNLASEKIYATLHFDLPVMRQKFIDSGILKENITVIGAPIKHVFLEPKNIPELKNKWGVSTLNPVVLVMMGAQGSQAVISYCQQLAKLKTSAHLFICIGKNTKLKKEIQKISFPSHLYLHIIEFSQEVDELMAIADLFITKTGGVSVCEGLYSHVPMLLDATAHTLTWERYNYELILKNKCGQKISDFKKVAPLVDYLLTHQELIQSMRAHMINFKKADSSKEIPMLINRILE